LIIFCIIFLIIALCLVFVAMPKIAQDGVNDSSIEFTDLEFLDPTPNSVVLTQKAILHSPSMYTPTLDAFNASLYLITNGTFASAPILQIHMPKIHALHPKSNVTILGQDLSISNLDQLTDFATAVLTNEEVNTALTGKTNLHLGGLPVVNVNYNTSTTYKGLNGLKGFNVTNALINPEATAGEPNLLGDAYIPNPSVMTIAMGNVTLIISTALGGVIGNASIPNMTLKPGNNTLPMFGTLDQTKVLASVNKTGFVELLIAGNSAIYNGQHLTYYEKALANNVLTLDVNLYQILADSAAAAGGA